MYYFYHHGKDYQSFLPRNYLCNSKYMFMVMLERYLSLCYISETNNQETSNQEIALFFKCFFSNEQNCSLEFSDLYNWLRVNLGVNFRFRAKYFLKVLPFIDNNNYTYTFDLKKWLIAKASLSQSHELIYIFHGVPKLRKNPLIFVLKIC